MCTSPIKLSRIDKFGNHSFDIVPCGKCHECVMKAQNEFAALACLEAKRRKSMWMVLFTYSNSKVPIMRCDFETLEDSETLSPIREIVSSRFLEGREREDICRQLDIDMDGKKRLSWSECDEVSFCPSLRREDVRLFLKRCRMSYKREFGRSLDFVYAGFGEYGDAYNRPHFHFLIYDLDMAQMAYVALCWQYEFGWCSYKLIPVLNPDGSPAHVKVSKYVAKYCHKPKKDFPPLLKGICEAPRRMSSRGFGVGVVDDKLKSFYLCSDLRSYSKDVRFSEILERRKSLVIDGSKFPLPRRISEKYYYKFYNVTLDGIDQDTGEITRQIVRKSIRSPLSREVSRFARDRYSESFIERVRAYSASQPDLPDCVAALQVLSDENVALEVRVEAAKKIYLQHLKNQNYG